MVAGLKFRIDQKFAADQIAAGAAGDQDAGRVLIGLPEAARSANACAARHNSAALKAWGGKAENAAAGQNEFSRRAKLTGLAALGKWTKEAEAA